MGKLSGQVHLAPRARSRSAAVKYPAALLAAGTVCGPAALTFAQYRCGALLILVATMVNSVITAATILIRKLGPVWLRLRAARDSLVTSAGTSRMPPPSIKHCGWPSSEQTC